MKKMNMYEAPAAEMIEIEAVGAMMTTTSPVTGSGATGGPTGGPIIP